MAPHHRHPLDIELHAVVDGADVDTALAAHVHACVLCRIRIGRLRRHGAGIGSSGSVPTVSVAPRALDLLAPSAETAPAAGQLWLAGNRRRTYVWIRKVLDGGVAVVHAATDDIEGADDLFVVTDRVDAIDAPVAVSAAILSTIRTDSLHTFVDGLDIGAALDALRDPERERPTGVATGRPIVSLTDERIEFHQVLADDLAALDKPVHKEDTGSGDDDPAAFDDVTELFEHVHDDLRTRRGSRCTVRPVHDPSLHAAARNVGCVPVAYVRELDVAVFVMAGPGRAVRVPHDGPRFLEVLQWAQATALAVAEPVGPFTTFVFESRDLHFAWEPPDATALRGPRHYWDPAPLTDAVFKYLEHAVFAIALPDFGSRAASPVDLDVGLESYAERAIGRIKSTRAQLTKREAFRQLDDADTAAVVAAIRTNGDWHRLRDAIDEIADR